MKKLIFVSAAIAILLISILSSQYSHGRGGGGHGGGGRGGHGGGGHRGGGGRGGHGYHGGGRGGHGYHGGYGRGGYGRGGYGRGYGGWGYGGWGTGVGVGLTTGLLVGAAASSGGGNTYVNYYPQDNQNDNSQQQDGPPSYVQMTNNTGNMITVKSLTTGDTASINPGVTTKLEGPSNGFQFEVRDASGKLIRTGASNNGSISIR